MKRSGSTLPLWLAGMALAAAIVGAYANGLRGPFVFDDAASITDNPSIQHLWPMGQVLRPPEGGETVTGRPLLNLSFALDYAAGGLNPWVYHVTNVAIHVAAALLLFGIVARTVNLWVGWIAALLWALHPLQTEAVTYAVQRAESLMGLFYLATLYAFIRGAARAEDDEGAPRQRRRPSRYRGGPIAISGGGFAFEARSRRWFGRRGAASQVGTGGPEAASALPAGTSSGVAGCGPGPARSDRVWLGASVLACLCGVATKEVIVSAPLVVLLYDVTFVAGSFGAAWRERRAYYIAMAATWVPLAWLVATGGNRGGTAGFGAWIPPWMYWITQGPAVLKYLRLVVWPHPLVFDYGFDRIWIQHRFAGAAISAFVVALAAGAVVLQLRPGRWRWIGFLGVVFFAILAPTSVIPGTRQTIAEHRIYLALAPCTVLIALALWRLACRRAWRAIAAAALLAAAAGAATAARNRDYHSELRLWETAVRGAPDNPYAHSSYGTVLFAAGRISDAAAEFRTAVTIYPDYGDARANLGAALAGTGHVPEALAELRRALATDPQNPKVRRVIGNVLVRLGQPRAAYEHFAAAVRLQPFNPTAEFDWGNACSAAGDWADAAQHLRAALEQRPDYPEAWNNLGNAQAQLGDAAGSVATFRRAIAQRADFGDAHNNLAISLIQLHRPAEAADEFRAAIACNPGSAQAHNNYANTLKQLGRLAEARREYDEALRLNPDYEDARRNRERL